jgi:hypothetical protein
VGPTPLTISPDFASPCLTAGLSGYVNQSAETPIAARLRGKGESIQLASGTDPQQISGGGALNASVGGAVPDDASSDETGAGDDGDSKRKALRLGLGLGLGLGIPVLALLIGSFIAGRNAWASRHRRRVMEEMGFSGPRAMSNASTGATPWGAGGSTVMGAGTTPGGLTYTTGQSLLSM